MQIHGYPIEIAEVLNGFIVTIGCKSVVIEGAKSFEEATDRLVKMLNGYLRDRATVEKEWLKRFPMDGRTYPRSHAPYTTTTTSTTLRY